MFKGFGGGSWSSFGGKLKEFAEEMGPDFEDRGLRQGVHRSNISVVRDR